MSTSAATEALPRVPVLTTKAPTVAARTKCVAPAHCPASSAPESAPLLATRLPITTKATSRVLPRAMLAPSLAPSTAPEKGRLALTSSAFSSRSSCSLTVTPRKL